MASKNLTTQYLIVGGMLNNDAAASACINEIQSSYFEDPSCSIIYQSFYNYYKKYKKLPSELELGKLIETNYIPLGVSLDEVKDTNHKLITLGAKVDQEYLMDNIEDFIKNVRVNRELEKFLEEYKASGNVDSSKFAKELSNSVDFTLAKSGISSMADIKDVLKARSEVIGQNDANTLIKSVFPVINSSFLYQGYVQGSLNVTVGPPGCFTGDTKIMTLDGKARTLKSLYTTKDHFGIYGINTEDKHIVPAPADKIVLSKYTKELIEVTINHKYKIKCTPDHPFMSIDGSYILAKDLVKKQDLLGIKRGFGIYGNKRKEIVSTDGKAKFTLDLIKPLIRSGNNKGKKIKYLDGDTSNNNIFNLEYTEGSEPAHQSNLIDINDTYKVTKVKELHLDEEVPVYGVMHAGFYGNYCLSLGKDDMMGVVVSNTGKTNMLVNEGAYAARQGANVLHIFLGDMMEYDGFIRYAANIMGEDQNKLIKMSPDQLTSVIKAYSSKDYGEQFKRVSYKAFASAEVTVDQLISYITNEEKAKGTMFDMIIVDYADNFAIDQSNSYSELGDVYDRLLWFARKNHSVILTASQPKVGYWDHEIIPMEGLGDSSKKQRIVDMIVSFNKPSRSSSVGTIYLSKVRRGITGNLARVKLDNKLCRITQISEDEYNQIRDIELKGQDSKGGMNDS